MTKIGNFSYKPKSTHPGSSIGLDPSTSSSPDLKHKQICLMLLIKSVFGYKFSRSAKLPWSDSESGLLSPHKPGNYDLYQFNGGFKELISLCSGWHNLERLWPKTAIPSQDTCKWLKGKTSRGYLYPQKGQGKRTSPFVTTPLVPWGWSDVPSLFPGVTVVLHSESAKHWERCHHKTTLTRKPQLTALMVQQTSCFFQAPPQNSTTINIRSRDDTKACQLDLYFINSS